MKIYYIRHCKTNANIKNKWQGISDIDVLEEYLQELDSLKKEIEKLNVDVFYVSPLKRAFKTALYINNNNKKIIVDDNIIERNFGKLELMDVNERDKELLADITLNTDLNMGVEKINDMYENRIKPFLLKIKKEHSNNKNNIVIVSHSWVGRLLAFYASNEKDHSIIKKAPLHGKLYEFDI